MPEERFHQALSIACNQQAKSLELRAATSLSRLWQSQNKRQDAYDLLAPVYGWFGAPAAYDYGPQRVSWLGHLMSHWMGDDGWLQTLNVQVRRFNIVGDLTRCKGVVTGKRVEGNDHSVDCDIWAENQREERTAYGTASVILPSRAS